MCAASGPCGKPDWSAEGFGLGEGVAAAPVAFEGAGCGPSLFASVTSSLVMTLDLGTAGCGCAAAFLCFFSLASRAASATDCAPKAGHVSGASRRRQQPLS